MFGINLSTYACGLSPDVDSTTCAGDQVSGLYPPRWDRLLSLVGCQVSLGHKPRPIPTLLFHTLTLLVVVQIKSVDYVYQDGSAVESGRLPGYSGIAGLDADQDQLHKKKQQQDVEKV